MGSCNVNGVSTRQNYTCPPNHTASSVNGLFNCTANTVALPAAVAGAQAEVVTVAQLAAQDLEVVVPQIEEAAASDQIFSSINYNL